MVSCSAVTSHSNNNEVLHEEEEETYYTPRLDYNSKYSIYQLLNLFTPSPLLTSTAVTSVATMLLLLSVLHLVPLLILLSSIVIQDVSLHPDSPCISGRMTGVCVVWQIPAGATLSLCRMEMYPAPLRATGTTTAPWVHAVSCPVTVATSWWGACRCSAWTTVAGLGQPIVGVCVFFLFDGSAHCKLNHYLLFK